MRKLTFLLACLLLVGIGLVNAQSKSISGKVLSADDGQPIIGATVKVKGSSTGTITNANGGFKISVQEGKTLSISYIGMKSQEIVPQDGVVVKLISDSKVMNEIVVTAIGIAREKKTLGYAASSVSGSDLVNAQKTNPMAALQGKVAGVDIMSSPGPGSTQNVIIRGASSFGNNQPLYVIDGVPLTNEQNRAGDNMNSQVDFGSGINALNPDDIEEMTVLKGSAASALYGSRAANGVIMIKTKSGKDTNGKVQVSYNGSISTSRVGRLPNEQTMFGQGWSGDRALDENGSWGAAFDGKDRVWGNIVDNSQMIKPYSYLNNRIRDFYDNGLGINNALSLSGGNGPATYYLSLSQNSVDGVIPTNKDSYKRYTLSNRSSYKSGAFNFSTSINYSNETNKSMPSGQGTSMLRSLYEIANDISIVDLKDYNNKFLNLDNYFTPYGLNPYYVLAKNGAEQKKNKFFGKFQIDYNPVKNLTFTYRFGGDYETSLADTYSPVISFSPDAANYGSSTAAAGNYEEMRRQRIQVNHDLFGNYNKRFNDSFTVNVTAGVNVNERSYSYLSGSINSIDIPEFYNLINSLSPSTSEQYKEKMRLMGVYGSADLGFKDYLYLTMTARNDWSSTLPINSNSYFYPGVSMSFIATDYLKQKNIETGVLDFAKLRMSYAMTGNDAEPYYIYDRYVSAFSSNPGYPELDNLKFPLGGINSYSVSDRLGNKDLKPELTNEFEVGSELRLFSNRLGVDFTYYNKYTKGLIEVLPKDPSSGYTSQISNLGDISNKGYEIALDITPVKTKNFKWTINWNFSQNFNKVEKLDIDEVYIAGFSGTGIYAVKGMALGQFKSKSVQKVIVDGKESVIVDGKGMPLATTDMVYVGKDVNEKFRTGLGTTVTWKDLSLGATFDFRYGGSMFSYTKDYMHWTGGAPESVLNGRNPFIVPNSVVSNGDGTYSVNTVPVDPTALHTFYSNGGMQGEEYSILDRSYLKLRNVNLAYNLPANLCKKLKLKSVRLSLTASNILLWTPVENQYIDPETTTFGSNIGSKFGEFGANPTNEDYVFGLSVNF